jgi:peptidyl-prolyl cis-trans isomerase C
VPADRGPPPLLSDPDHEHLHFPLPQVNGVVLAYPHEGLTTEALRQRACAELLRQAAIQAGLLAADDPLPWVAP